MSASPSEEACGAGGLRIVVADDFRDAAESLAQLLRLHGYEVAVAHGGEEAVAAAERFRPDAVLLDLRMPGVDGFEACRRIRAAPWSRGMLVIAQSGFGLDPASSERARTAGFDAQLVKPVAAAALAEVISRRRDREGAGRLGA
jgi:CheY-like chemotaxis protein